jgi:eukaryotic-like serine/threonine-protein kinase
VSDGTGEAPTVPDVLGLTLDEAVQLLSDLGYEVGMREVDVDDEDLDGRVVATSPRPGTELIPGDDIQVVVDVGRFVEPDDDDEEEEPEEDDDGDDEDEEDGRGPDGDGPPGQDRDD